MRVLAITNMYPTPDRPWVGTFVEQQVRGLQAAGVGVKVLYFDRNRKGPFVYYGMGRPVTEAIAGFRPDLIHVMYGGVMADKITRRSWSTPVVVTFHGSDLLGENLSGLLRRMVSHYGVHCSRRAARRAAGVVVVARHLLKALPFDFPLPSDGRGIKGEGLAQPSTLNHPSSTVLVTKEDQPLTPIVRVIPCGIDLERFKPMDKEACRQKLGWPPGTFHILFPANAGNPVKRPWLAQAAVQALKEAGVEAQLHPLSGVPYKDVPLWVNASDVLVLTSLHEGSPTVVKEALACTLPVVSVDVGDVAERIEGIEGCYLAKAEPGDLALHLLQVWSRKSRVDSASTMQSLSIQNIAERLKTFYGQLLQSAAARHSAEIAGMEALCAASPRPAKK